MLDFQKISNMLPVANANFRFLRSHGLIYVDKTKYVYNLAYNNRPRVLVRPRRFGKSTLMSALEELFLHGVKPYDGHDSYFKGLAVEELWQDTGRYYVLHLDFYNLNLQCSSFDQFESKIKTVLDDFALQHQLDIKASAPDFSSKFESLLQMLPDYSLVLLADEYDAPLLYRLKDNEEKQKAAAFMQALFGLIKSYSEKYRCVFVTGITRYQDLGLGTAGGSFTDITHDPNFSACCGYTRAELKQYFADNLRYSAAYRLHIRDEDITEEQIDALLDALSQWYDGFCFDRYQEQKVFSTWSVLRFLGDQRAELQPYWTTEESLGMPQLLKTYIERLNLSELLKETYSGGFCITFDEFIQSSLANPEANPYALLFQTGYLTLTEPFLNGDPIYLDCPNREISMAFANLLSRRMFSRQFRYTVGYGKRTVEILASLNSSKIQAYFNELFAAIPYEQYPVHSESMVAALINFHLRGAGLSPRCEVSESTGRADAEIDFRDQELTLVFEYKYEQSADPKQLEAKLQEAIEQIKSRQYGLTADSEHRIVRFALVFCGDPSQRKIARLEQVDQVCR